MDSSPLHDRLSAVLGDMSYRQIGELTVTNAETTRRYMQGATPSVEFLAAVCTKLEINAEWLLTGRGVIKRKDAKSAALREANVSELLRSLAETLEKLIERVDRLESYVHTVETRLRAAGSDGVSPHASAALSPTCTSSPSAASYVEAHPAGPARPQRATPLAAGAADDLGRSIADALAKRSPQDDR